MSNERPTPSQTRVLQLLSAFEYLTTREIYEYLAQQTTKRAVEQRLHLLLQHGFIGSALLNPLQGRASERRWALLKKGCDVLGVAFEPPGTQRASARRGVTQREAALLHLLAEMKHLTSDQVRRHLHGDKPEWYTWQLLNKLQRLGYVRGQRIHPERGAASECYWTIRKAGATAIGAIYDMRYLRRPARRTIEHRGLLLEMRRQVQAAGWSLIKPLAHSSRRAAPAERSGEPPAGGRHTVLNAELGGGYSVIPGDTPQRQRLVEAVLYREAIAIEKLIRQGYAVAGLQDRIERLKAGQVGAVVPRAVNDYVAYVPGAPGQTAVLIPHPPWAGRAFWSRRPGRRKFNTSKQDRPQDSPRPRLERYARLSRVVPVLGVFATHEAAGQYGSVLAAAGLQWTLVEDVRDKLLEIARSARDKAEA